MGASLPKHKKLIPISEATKILGVSIDTVRRWDKSGVLHSERPDGKNRYFSLDELEKYKLSQPLSISEAAIMLNISPTTLRRLEERGLFKPGRNSAGERVYDKQSLKNFLNSDYFLRKKPIEKKIIEPSREEVKNTPKESIRINLKPFQRTPELLAATVMFFLLVAIGVTNIQAPAVKSPLSFLFSNKVPAPAVLSQTIEAVPEATAEVELNPSPVASAGAVLDAFPTATPIATAEADLSDIETTPMEIVTVIFEDKSSVANIRQKPSTTSRIIGQAPNGSSYELISKTTDWYEVKLVNELTGFISAKYIWKEEGDN